MLLMTKKLGLTDTRRYEVDYSDYLCPGDWIVSATVTLPSGVTSTASAATLNSKKTSVVFFITAGSVKETFTADVEITTDEGEIITDTVNFVVTDN